MKEGQFSRKTLLLALPLAMLVYMGNCGATDITRSELEKTLDRDKVVTWKPPAIEDARIYANQFAPMALFAQTAYRKDIKNDKRRQGHGCDYLKKEVGYDAVIKHQMPKSENGHWERSTEPGSCVEEGGMFFETYIHKNKAEIVDQAVIAFRGTENYSIYESDHDWGANLSGFLPFMGREYERARDSALPLITKLHQNMGSDGKPIPIYLTGHSLGGGLAQYIAYLADKMVKATYAFDTSPGTHWFQLREYEQAHDPVIYRVYQKREALSLIRNITTRLNITRYNRTDYAFDLVKAGAVGSHSINHLTCELAMLASSNNNFTENNPFDYSKASAQATLDDKCLCPPIGQPESACKN